MTNRFFDCDTCRYSRYAGNCMSERKSDARSGDGEGCYQELPEKLPSWDALVDGARQRYHADSREAALAWLTEQAAALLEEERARRAFDRGEPRPSDAADLVPSVPPEAYAAGVIRCFDLCRQLPEARCCTCMQKDCTRHR
jgi:hypothetical protein